jgi:iron complex transport system permease protein
LLLQGVNGIKKKLLYFLLIIGRRLYIYQPFLGRYPVPVSVVAKVLWCKTSSSTCIFPDAFQVLVWDIRLPRAILGALVEDVWRSAGRLFKVCSQPLVSSGISASPPSWVRSRSGYLLFNATAPIYIFAFLFGGLAVFLSYWLAELQHCATIMLVLGGTIVSSIFTALISLAKYVADPSNELPSIVFWLMGSLASARYQDIFIAGIPM